MRDNFLTVELFNSLVKPLERLHEISANSAADATIHHLDDLLVDGLGKDLFVNANLSEFILDDGEFHAVGGVIEDVVEQRRFASSEETSEDGDGDFARHLALHYLSERKGVLRLCLLVGCSFFAVAGYDMFVFMFRYEHPFTRRAAHPLGRSRQFVSAAPRRITWKGV